MPCRVFVFLLKVSAWNFENIKYITFNLLSNLDCFILFHISKTEVVHVCMFSKCAYSVKDSTVL